MAFSHRVLNDLEWAREYAKVCASRFSERFDIEDLQSAGIMAFLTAADRYDEKKGVPFRGFCSSRIRGAIIDEVRRWGWAPRSFFRNQQLLESTTCLLISELEREPTAVEIGTKLGIDQAAVIAMQELAAPRKMYAWDEVGESTREEDTASLAERTPDENSKRPDAELLSSEQRRNLLCSIGKLPHLQAFVVTLHYLKDVPLGEISKLTGLSASRISQLHHQALGRLKILLHLSL